MTFELTDIPLFGGVLALPFLEAMTWVFVVLMPPAFLISAGYMGGFKLARRVFERILREM